MWFGVSLHLLQLVRMVRKTAAGIETADYSQGKNSPNFTHFLPMHEKFHSNF